MSTTARQRKLLPGITVDPNVPDLRNSPFVIKKAERAKATIARVGLPKEETKKKR